MGPGLFYLDFVCKSLGCWVYFKRKAVRDLETKVTVKETIMSNKKLLDKMTEVVRCNKRRAYTLAKAVANSKNAIDIALAQEIIQHADQVQRDMECNLNFLIPKLDRAKFCQATSVEMPDRLRHLLETYEASKNGIETLMDMDDHNRAQTAEEAFPGMPPSDQDQAHKLQKDIMRKLGES